MLFLTGCSTMADGPAEAPPLATAACDYEGPSGICVQVDTEAPRVDFLTLEAAYLKAKRDVETQYRLDLSGTRGPTVRVMHVVNFARLHPIHNRQDGDLGGDHGWTGFADGEIRITGPAVMRHEALHYLLWKAGYPNRLNAAHEHPAFDEYRDGNWLPKRVERPTVVSATQDPQTDRAVLLPAASAPALRKATTH